MQTLISPGSVSICVHPIADEDIESYDEEANVPFLLDVLMEPGDAIWIPMYYPHLATSQTKRLSVSFPMGRTSIEDVREEREWITL